MAEDVNFVITNPAGKSTHSNDKRVTMKVLEGNEDLYLTASLTHNADHFEVSKRIEVNYKPKEKLSPGTINSKSATVVNIWEAFTRN